MKMYHSEKKRIPLFRKRFAADAAAAASADVMCSTAVKWLVRLGSAVLQWFFVVACKTCKNGGELI